MRCILDATGARWVPVVCDVVEHGSTVLTHGWSGYNDLAQHGLTHRRILL
jgi:transposase-like protein